MLKENPALFRMPVQSIIWWCRGESTWLADLTLENRGASSSWTAELCDLTVGSCYVDTGMYSNGLPGNVLHKDKNSDIQENVSVRPTFLFLVVLLASQQTSHRINIWPKHHALLVRRPVIARHGPLITSYLNSCKAQVSPLGSVFC